MRCLFFAFLLLFTPLLFANEIKTYSFKIYIKGESKNLSKVEVKATDQLIWYSDQEGIVQVSLPDDLEKLELSKAGFKTLFIFVSELKEQETKSVYLEPSEPNDEEIIIRGDQKKSVSKKTISIEEAKIVAPRGDPAQITKLLPGVQSSAFRPDVAIRGSAPSDSRYFVDGISIPFIYHSIGGLSVIQEYLLKDVAFYAGGFDADYGEATGGVIVLQTENEHPEQTKTYFKVNVPFYSGLYFQSPLSEFESLSCSFRRSYLDAFISKFAQDSSTTVVPVFWDSHIRYMKKDDESTIKITALSSLDALKLKTKGPGDESGSMVFDISNYFGAFGIEYGTKLSNGWKLQTTPQIVFTKVANRFVESKVNIKGPAYKIPIEFSQSLKKQDRFSFGVEFNRNQADVDVYAPKIDRSEPFADFEDAPLVGTTVSYLSHELAAFTIYDYRINSDLVITPSLRAYYSTQMKKSAFDPRSKLVYKLTKETTLKAALGQYSKSPTPQETDSSFGNPKLGFEHSLHYILGVDHEWSDRFSSEVQAYFKDNYHMIAPDKQTTFNNKGYLKSYGLELFMRRNRTEKFFGWLSYTYAVTRQKDAKGDPWIPVSYDQTHNMNLVSGYSFSSTLSVGNRINYHTGDRVTPVSYATYQANLGKYQARIYENGKYSDRLPPYTQIDLYIGKDILFNTWKLQTKTGVEYLAFKRPAFGVTYNYDYSKKTYFTGVPPIPYFEISGAF